MPIPYSKVRNFFDGLLLGIIPIFVFLLLFVATEQFFPIGDSNLEAIEQSIKIALIGSVFFAGIVHFGYFFDRFQTVGKTTTNKGLYVAFWLSILILVGVTHLTS